MLDLSSPAGARAGRRTTLLTSTLAGAALLAVLAACSTGGDAASSDAADGGSPSDLGDGGSSATGGDGGTTAPPAPSCAKNADCPSGVCNLGKGTCDAPTCTDGVKNGNESDLDCGGTNNPACADGKACARREDCTSAFCKANVCTAPTPADGVQNGDETDVDCRHERDALRGVNAGHGRAAGVATETGAAVVHFDAEGSRVL